MELKDLKRNWKIHVKIIDSKTKRQCWLPENERKIIARYLYTSWVFLEQSSTY